MSQELLDKIAALEKRVSELEEKLPEDKVTLVVFSGDLDRAIAAFIIATGAAALNQEVTMFFTFWGLNILRSQKKFGNKDLLSKAMSVMAPNGSQNLPLSQMNFFGIGSKLMRQMMKSKNVSSLEDLIAMAKEMGVKFIACEMSRDLLGIEDDEIIPNVESGGVSSFLGEAIRSHVTLFI